MSTGPKKSMMRAMQKKPAKAMAMARTTASRHGKGGTNRVAPRRACNYRPHKHHRLTGKKRTAVYSRWQGPEFHRGRATHRWPGTREQKYWEAQTLRDTCEKGNDI